MFLTPLVLEADARPERWIIAAPLIWSDPLYGRISLPVGFRTDMASTPFHIDDDGASRRPACVHDALYKLGRERGKDWADSFLRYSIITEGGGHFRAEVYYLGVHWFGRRSWASDGLPPTAGDFGTPGAWAAWRLSGGLFRS